MNKDAHIIYTELLERVQNGTATKADNQLLEQIQIQLARQDFKIFCHLVRPNYKWQWFHQYVMERMQSKVEPQTDYEYEYSRLLFRMGDQHGKGLCHGTPVKTITGWKNIEHVEIGDELDSGLGYSTKVIGVYPQGLKECFRVTFIDGRYVDCDDTHLWEIHSTEFKKDKIRVINTKEILRLHSCKKYYKNLCIPYYEPLNSQDIDLPINPYLLGILLGDGSLTDSKLSFTSADEFLINKCTNILNLYGDTLSKYGKYDYGIIRTQRNNKISHTKDKLIKLNLFNVYSYNKYIPKLYFNASYSQRLELIKGLMDTDGSIGKNSTIEYSTISYQLALDMQYMIRSIGGQCKIKTSQPTYNYKGKKKYGQIAYKLAIRHRDQTLLFSLPRKLERCKNIHRRSNAKLAVWDIQPINKTETTCIKVDNKQGLFTTKDFIVTHNTELAARLFPAWCLGRYPNKQILYLTYSDERAKQPTRDLINILIDPIYKKIFPEFALADELSDVERQAEKSGQKLTNRFFTNANSPKPGKQGLFLASSLGGSYLGNSGDIIICDDLFAGQKEANSSTIRDGKWELFSSSVLSRQQKSSAIILMGTWWNKDDIIGRVQTLYIDNEQYLEKGTAKWELIELNSQKDHREYPYDKREFGEYLWPEERMLAYLDQKQTNPAMWAIKHQNLPPDINGVLFKPTSFRVYDKLPTAIENMKIIISIDSNYKVTNTSDHAGIVVYAVYGMKAYLLEYYNKKYTLPQLLEEVVKITIKYPNYWSILVEVKSQGQPFMDMAPLYGLSRVHGFEPQGKGDKWERANVVLPIFDAGQVFVPNDKTLPSINFYLNQHLSFSGEDGRADDLVDATTQLFLNYDYLFRGIPIGMPRTIQRSDMLQGTMRRVMGYKSPVLGRK